MRIFLVILLILLLLIELLMLLTGVLRVKFQNGQFQWQLRVLGIRILPRSPKRKKKQNEEVLPPEDMNGDGEETAGTEEKPTEQDKEIQAEGTEEKKTPMQEDERKRLLADRIWHMVQKIAEKADMGGNIFNSLPRPLKTLCKGISLCKVKIDFLIACEDAADCALTYGSVQAAVQCFLSDMGKHFRVKRKKICIQWDYTADKSRWDFGLDLRVRLGPLIAAALYFWIDYQLDIRRTRKAVSGRKI